MKEITEGVSDNELTTDHIIGKTRQKEGIFYDLKDTSFISTFSVK